MKKCRKCQVSKETSEFHKHSGKKDGLQDVCKVCSIETSKQWYIANKHAPSVVARLVKCDRATLMALKKEVDDIKAASGCVLCPEKAACCLDFHHLGGKDQNVSYWRKCKSRKRLYDEISKCVVICANCHRKLHAGLLSLDKSQLVQG